MIQRNSTSHHSSQSIAGFTLLEVLIAVMLLSLLMLAVLPIIDNATTSKEMVLGEDQELFQVENAFSRISLDITQIYSPLYHEGLPKKTNATDHSIDTMDEREISFTPTENFKKITINNNLIPTFFNESKNDIAFYTSSNRRKFQDIKQSKFSWVRYSLRDSKKPKIKDAPKELVRQFAPNNPYDEEIDWDSIKQYVLLDNITSLEFSFWDRKKEKFLSSVAELSNENKIIRAIKVKLVWHSMVGESDSIEQITEQIFTPLWPYYDLSLDKPVKKDLNTTEDNDE